MGMIHFSDGDAQSFQDRINAGEFVLNGYDQHGNLTYIHRTALVKPFQDAGAELSKTLHLLASKTGFK